MGTFKHKNRVPTLDMSDICVIGAGPAGLMAAIQAGKLGVPTVVLEAGKVPCQKLLLTGGGRCNLSHAGSPAEILDRLRPKDRFLRHAIHTFPPDWVIRFFGELGLETVTEPDGRIFPRSNLALDVKDALLEAAKMANVKVMTGCKVRRIRIDGQRFVIESEKGQFLANGLVLATGGLSYPQTGSTGDWLRLAQGLGHKIVSPRPGLVPLVSKELWPRDLAGISLQEVRLVAEGQRRFVESGPLVFTEDGIGGPAALDLSRDLAGDLAGGQAHIEVHLDLAPALCQESLERMMVQWANQTGSRQVLTCMAQVLPRRLAEVVLEKAGCSRSVLASQLDRKTRFRIMKAVKAMPLTITGTRPIGQAMITIGGVDTRQIDPKTMGSMVCPGLFFAGEILDVDGPCGGYNLQICWSTGALAGRSAAQAATTQGR